MPSYFELVALITARFNEFERRKCDQLAALLNPYQKELLDGLLDTDSGESPLSRLKRINQSLQPQAIAENVTATRTIGELFFNFEAVFKKLDLSDQAVEYLSTWVKKAGLFQIGQFVENEKRYLYVLAFIRHQFYLRQDSLMDGFIKSVRFNENKAKAAVRVHEQQHKIEMMAALKALTASHQTLQQFVDQVTAIVQSGQPESQKLKCIQELIDLHNQRRNKGDLSLSEHELRLNADAKNQAYYDALDAGSLKLQRRVAPVLKVLHFDKASSSLPLYQAIEHFKQTDGHLGHSPPTEFLEGADKDAIADASSIKISLYKALLFR